MESHGEVCLEEEVDRLRQTGMSVKDISDATGLEPAWISSVVEMMPDEAPEPEDREPA